MEDREPHGVSWYHPTVQQGSWDLDQEGCFVDLASVLRKGFDFVGRLVLRVAEHCIEGR